MKRFAIAAIALLCCQPAMAGPRTSDGFEVEPSHCVKDYYHGWNCWYTPVKKKRRAWKRYDDCDHSYCHHHHRNWSPYYERVPVFRPNRWNHHGTPCYFYKDENWCF